MNEKEWPLVTLKVPKGQTFQSYHCLLRHTIRPTCQYCFHIIRVCIVIVKLQKLTNKFFFFLFFFFIEYCKLRLNLIFCHV